MPAAIHSLLDVSLTISVMASSRSERLLFGAGGAGGAAAQQFANIVAGLGIGNSHFIVV